ncbi:MAG: 4Fe-4S binding protein [Desulfatiglandales bacterium]
MENTVFKKLAQHLNKLPGGFPPTETGVELRILRRLFTLEEAELALHLTLIPEQARIIAYRAKISNTDAEARLEEMANKGLIFRIQPEDEPAMYMAQSYVIGIWEFHVNDLDPEFIRDMGEYLPQLFKEAWKVPQLRTIPVRRSITAQLEVLPYEAAEVLVRKQETFAVAPCICRREQKMIGKGCRKPEKTCLVFGMAADYYVRNGIGRATDLKETLEILKTADEEGLVLQPSNTQDVLNICCCCGDCCGVLRTVKKFPRPASLVFSPFFVSINPDTCQGCGLCVERCQMDALSLVDEKATLNLDNCIGCGLCVSTCPTESLTLVRKAASDQPNIPKDIIKASIQRGRKRGTLTPLNLVQMQIKSKIDRLLAAR